MIKHFKKIIFFISIITIISLIYLSYFGVKTKSFNTLIKEKISQNKKDVKVELDSVKIKLKLSNLSLNLETENTEIFLGKKKIEIEKITSNLSIKSFFQKNFTIDDLEVLSKKIKLKDTISIFRVFKNSPELFIFEKIIENGFIVLDVKLNFDDKGNINKNYSINGFLSDGIFKLLKNGRLEDLNLSFEITNNEYLLKNIKSNYKKIKINSKKIKISNKKEFFFIEGDLSNPELEISENLISHIFKKELNLINFQNLKLSSSNDFSFVINKNFKISELDIKSNIGLKNLDYNSNNESIKNLLPSFNNNMRFQDHEIKLAFKDKEFKLEGEGKFLFGKVSDTIEYKILKDKKENIIFDTNIYLEKNPILLKIFDYKKKQKQKSTLKLKGILKKNGKVFFKSIHYQQDKNILTLEKLHLGKNLKIDYLNNIKLDIFNTNNLKNSISLQRNKKNYEIKGEILDADQLIQSILDSNDSKGISNFINELNSSINIEIKKVYLDKLFPIENLNGSIKYKAGNLVKADLNAYFTDNKIVKFTVNTNESNKKITTFYSDYAKPFVNKYEFIEGFDGGSLDFYSIKDKTSSKSKLKLYDFKLKKLPALTKLLTLASLQGIADLLKGDGIRFDEFEMNFSNKGKLTNIEEIYSIGPSISILMDGYIEANKLVSLRGTLVPATTINKAISSIPLLGNILVGKKTGEGVFGVSFKIKGSPKDLKTTVNPIKTLTPRFITRTLEKFKKN